METFCFILNVARVVVCGRPTVNERKRCAVKAVILHVLFFTAFLFSLKTSSSCEVNCD